MNLANYSCSSQEKESDVKKYEDFDWKTQKFLLVICFPLLYSSKASYSKFLSMNLCNKYFLELEQEVLHKSKEPHNNAIFYLCVFISMVVVTIDKYLKLFINKIKIYNYIFKMHCLVYKKFQIFVGRPNIFPKLLKTIARE